MSLNLGIGSNFSKLMSVTIHGPFSLESVSGVRFWVVSDIFGQKNQINHVNLMNFLMEKLARFLAIGSYVVAPL